VALLDRQPRQNAHTSIYSISESPKNGQISGGDRTMGNLQNHADGRRPGRNVIGNVSGAWAKNSWVSTVEAKPLRRRHGLPTS